jgi:hypothetical protein
MVHGRESSVLLDISFTTTIAHKVELQNGRQARALGVARARHAMFENLDRTWLPTARVTTTMATTRDGILTCTHHSRASLESRLQPKSQTEMRGALSSSSSSSSVPARGGAVCVVRRAVEVTQDDDDDDGPDARTVPPKETTAAATASRHRGLPRRGRRPCHTLRDATTDWNSTRSRQQRKREDALAKEWIMTNTTATKSALQSSARRGAATATAPTNPRGRSAAASHNSAAAALSTPANLRCDWRFPWGEGSMHNSNNNNHSAHVRGRRVREYHHRSLVSSSTTADALRPRLLHRNLHGTSYGPITMLDPRDDLVAALNPAQKRIDLLRIDSFGATPSQYQSQALSSSSGLIQHVSISTHPQLSSSLTTPLGSGGSRYGLRSIENGHGLAVGLPTGDFLVFSAETGQPIWGSSGGHTSHHRTNSRNGTHCGDIGGPHWTSRRHTFGPARRYRPCSHWTLPQQWDRTDPCSHHDHLRHHQLDDLVEMCGWSRRGWGARARPGPNHADAFYEDGDGDDEPVVVSSPTAYPASWDFCEASALSLSSSSLVAAHVGEDYVGVRMAEDRLDVTHILILGGDKDNTKKKTMPALRPATGVAFCAGGRLLATAHVKQRSNPFAFDDANDDPMGVVMLWDLRMAKLPADAILPSFPREAAQRMLDNDAIETFAFDDFHRRGHTLELPQMGQHQGSLVCLSSLERAMLCHRLLPAGRGKIPLATTLHVDGIRIDAGHDSLHFTDVEQQLAERRLRDSGPENPKKRAYSQTLERLFDGTLSPCSQARHHSIDHQDPYARHRSAVPIHLEDRYGCSTSVSSLCVSQQPAGRIVGGTCDGDIYLFESKAISRF